MRDSGEHYSFSHPLGQGTIVARPNRFIFTVRADDKVLRCHCPTTGRLGDLDVRGLPCLYSTSERPGRKTAHTVEAISTSGDGSSWIGINQTAANRYLEAFLKSGALRRMATGGIKREVRLGSSRIDFLVGTTYIEVKTPLITLPSGEGVRKSKPSRFDSFDRLIRHLGELRKSLEDGKRAVIVLCYQYDAKPFRPPRQNGSNSVVLEAARAAESAGVERWQVNLRIDRDGVSLIRYFRSRPYT